MKDGMEQESYDKVTESSSTNTTLEDNVDMSGMELDRILNYSFEDGAFHFLVMFRSGQRCSVPYANFKEDF